MALGAIWGASFLFIEIGLRDMSPLVVAWVRRAPHGRVEGLAGGLSLIHI